MKKEKIPYDAHIKKTASIIEAVLFALGNDVLFKTLQETISLEYSVGPKEISKALVCLQERYQREESGLQLRILEKSCQLVTKSQTGFAVEALLRPIKKKNLTQAALETLSIIAWNQPVTKQEIEQIRGVQSDSILNNLLETGMIQEAGRLDKIGRPILYATTRLFLNHFDLQSLNDLPPLEEFTDQGQQDLPGM